jgi:hypothetical protein
MVKKNFKKLTLHINTDDNNQLEEENVLAINTDNIDSNMNNSNNNTNTNTVETSTISIDNYDNDNKELTINISESKSDVDVDVVLESEPVKPVVSRPNPGQKIPIATNEVETVSNAKILPLNIEKNIKNNIQLSSIKKSDLEININTDENNHTKNIQDKNINETEISHVKCKRSIGLSLNLDTNFNQDDQYTITPTSLRRSTPLSSEISNPSLGRNSKDMDCYKSIDTSEKYNDDMSDASKIRYTTDVDVVEYFNFDGSLPSNRYKYLKIEEKKFFRRSYLMSIYWLMPFGKLGTHGIEKRLRARIVNDHWRPIIKQLPPAFYNGKHVTCRNYLKNQAGEFIEREQNGILTKVECGETMVQIKVKLPYGQNNGNRDPKCHACNEYIDLQFDGFYYHCPAKHCGDNCTPCCQETSISPIVEQNELCNLKDEKNIILQHFRFDIKKIDDNLSNSVSNCPMVCKSTICKKCGEKQNTHSHDNSRKQFSFFNSNSEFDLMESDSLLNISIENNDKSNEYKLGIEYLLFILFFIFINF